jgi:hypothetical protein
MKKIVLLAMMAVALLAAARPTGIIVPIPQCNPCDMVR